MSNSYAKVIDIISSSDVDWKALVVQISKTNPSVVVRAMNDIDSPSKAAVVEKECRHLIETNDTMVPAVKHYRSITGANLKEAVEYVKSLSDDD